MKLDTGRPLGGVGLSDPTCPRCKGIHFGEGVFRGTQPRV